MWSPNHIYNFTKRISIKFKIEQSSEKINSVRSMALAGALFDKTGLNDAVNAIQIGKGRPFTVIRRVSGVILPKTAIKKRKDGILG